MVLFILLFYFAAAAAVVVTFAVGYSRFFNAAVPSL